MKPQQFLILLVALGAGLAAAVMTQNLLGSRDVDDENKVPVVVAALPIPRGVIINETHVKLDEMDKDQVPEDAVRDLNEAIGKSVSFRLSEKQLLQKTFFSQGGSGIAAVLQKGMRAAAFPITSERAVAGFIKPDSHVDIVLTIKQMGPTRNSYSKTILQNIKVLAVNTTMATQQGSDDQGKVVEMVTFELTPDQAEQLNLALNAGTLSLVLRSENDDAYVKSTGASLEDMFKSKEDDAINLDQDKPTPVIVQPTNQGPGIVDLLGNLMAKREEKDAALEAQKAAQEQQAALEKQLAQNQQPEVPAEVEPTPEPAEVKPPVMKEVKWLVYRDLEGNELMRVLVDADSDIANSLKDHLEDADPVEVEEGESINYENKK